MGSTHARDTTSSLSSLLRLYNGWQLLDLSPVLEVGHIVLLEILLLNHCPFVEEAFRKSVILSFNSLGLFLTDSQIQTCGLIHSILRSRGTLANLIIDSWDGGPLSIRNVNKFAQKNLILSANDNVFLRLIECCSFFLFSLKFAHVSFNDASLVWLDHSLRCKFLRMANLRDLIELGLMDALVADK